MGNRILMLLLAPALVCLSTPKAFGQVTATATLQRSVTDKTAAVVLGAEITLSSKSTGLKRMKNPTTAAFTSLVSCPPAFTSCV